VPSLYNDKTVGRRNLQCFTVRWVVYRCWWKSPSKHPALRSRTALHSNSIMQVNALLYPTLTKPPTDLTKGHQFGQHNAMCHLRKRYLRERELATQRNVYSKSPPTDPIEAHQFGSRKAQYLISDFYHQQTSRKAISSGYTRFSHR
jgi:hypothetical protein